MNDASRTSNPMVPTPKEVMYNVAMMELPGIAGAVQAQAQRLYDAAVAQDEEIKRLRAALERIKPLTERRHGTDYVGRMLAIERVITDALEAAPADETKHD